MKQTLRRWSLILASALVCGLANGFDTENTVHVPEASAETDQTTYPVGVLLENQYYYLYPSTQTAELVAFTFETEGDVEIPASITVDGISFSVTSIRDCALQGLAVTSVTIPSTVVQIGTDAFADCRNLKSIVIPNSVTSIGERACAYCEALECVVIGQSVVSIGAEAFAYCFALSSVTNLATTAQEIDPSVFEDRPLECTLHILPGCRKSYISTYVWQNFDIVEDAAEQPVGGETEIAVMPKATAHPTAYYSVAGIHSSNPRDGLNIIWMSDGSVRKTFHKN